MERGKSGSGRGGKNKAPQHPVDLFVLGAKASRGELSDTKRPGHTKPGASHASLPGKNYVHTYSYTNLHFVQF
jgi:hypothetical protein